MEDGVCSTPLMRVRNSACFTRLLCMSIFSVSRRVNRNLCSSYRPLAAYLCTSKVICSIMFAIRLLVIGLLVDLFRRHSVVVIMLILKLFLWFQILYFKNQATPTTTQKTMQKHKSPSVNSKIVDYIFIQFNGHIK